MVKDERGNLLADPQQILNRWRNCFCLLLMYMGQMVSDRFKFTQQSFFVPESSASEVRSLLESLKGISRQALIRFEQN
jgi:hypothetical protein